MGILAKLPAEKLLAMQVGSFGCLLDAEDITAIIKATDSLWIYPGEFRAEAPHAKLTAGNCSTGFVNLRVAMSMPNLCDILAAQLVMRLRHIYFGQVDFVIGSDTASLYLAYAMARLLGARSYPMHKVSVREADKDVEKQTYTGPKVAPGSKVLRVEELMTTAKTFRLVTAGFVEANPGVDFIPFLPLIVDRRAVVDVDEVDGASVLALVRYDIKTWKPEECPLCALGSKAVRPNTPEGWAELTQATA
jgi:orotate phosphoribosyltransferase